MEDILDDTDSFYKELKRVFDKFPKYNRKILIGDFNVKVGREDIFNLQGLHPVVLPYVNCLFIHHNTKKPSKSHSHQL
jgi:exonuclease III